MLKVAGQAKGCLGGEEAVGGPPQPLAANRLSRRETEVFDLLSEGLTNKQIGSELCVSQETIKTHVSHIFRKLKLSNRTQAAAMAAVLKLGPTQPELQVLPEAKQTAGWPQAGATGARVRQR